MLHVNPMRSEAEAVGVVARILLLAFTLGSLRVLQWWSELVSVTLFATHIACFPLLSRELMCWLVGEDVAQIETCVRNGVAASDALSVIVLLASAMTFLVLVPVRIKKGWIVPTLTPAVYFCSTLLLPESGPESGFVNRLVTGCALGCVCLLVFRGRTEVELLFRCHFEKTDAVQNLMLPTPRVFGKCSPSEPPQDDPKAHNLLQESL